MKEKITEKKIDVIAVLFLLTSMLLLPALPVEAEKCPRFTDKKCYTVTEFRPGIEALNEGLKYEASDVGEPIERNFVTYKHSPLVLAAAVLLALSPLSLRAKEELESRV